MSDEFFIGKTAVVTGAGGTLCSVIAEDLAALGAKVALIGRTRGKLEMTAGKIREAGGECRIYVGDVTDEPTMKEIGNAVLQDLGPCRFLINGAGGNQTMAMTETACYMQEEMQEDIDTVRGFLNLDLDVMENVLKTNTFGSLIPIRVFVRHMLQNNGHGAVVNFASMNSYRPLTKVPAYAMAKAAVTNMTQWLATYFGATGIRFNAVAPGFFINERSAKFLGNLDSGLTERGQRVIDHTPMQRFGYPEDLLGCVRFLLDDRASGFVTGIMVAVDGGFLAHPGI